MFCIVCFQANIGGYFLNHCQKRLFCQGVDRYTLNKVLNKTVLLPMFNKNIIACVAVFDKCKNKHLQFYST